jgi:hypothetical protein
MTCTSHHYSFDEIEKDETDGACSTVRERGGVYRVLVGIPEGKRPLARTKHRWEDGS